MNRSTHVRPATHGNGNSHGVLNVMALTRNLPLERLFEAVMGGILDEEVFRRLDTEPIWWLLPLTENLPPLLTVIAHRVDQHSSWMHGRNRPLLEKGWVAMTLFWTELGVPEGFISFDKTFDPALDPPFDATTLKGMAEKLGPLVNEETKRLLHPERWQEVADHWASFDCAEDLTETFAKMVMEPFDGSSGTSGTLRSRHKFPDI